MSSLYDVAVIGGGILGTATAMRLTETYPGLRVVVLEKESGLAAHQTGHNSGVIHSGIYYRPGSLKATNCIAGYRQLLRFCDDDGIKYDLCGKLIIATSEAESPRLDELYRRGTANGVPGLRYVEAAEIRAIEPHAAGIRGLFSPATGIIDYKEVTAVYAKHVTDQGGEIRLNAAVDDVHVHGGRSYLATPGGEIEARYVINCAGLYADVLSRKMGAPETTRIVPFRGEYYMLRPEAHHLVKGLIYPVPDPEFPFLGVHFTRSIHGGVEAGPNAVLALAREGYSKSSIRPRESMWSLAYPGFWSMARRYWKTGLHEVYRSFSKKAFTKALQRLVPEITEADLISGGAGVRAQAVDPNGTLADDFRIVETANAIHVLNAPSPGATASLAISSEIVRMAVQSFDLSAVTAR